MSVDDVTAIASDALFLVIKVSDRRTSDQYLSDGNVDPGTDTDFCTKDTGSFSVHYRAGKLDAYADNRVYEQTVV